jgi:hypothetical protein
MRSLETLRNVGNKKLATGLVVVAGALGLSACGEERGQGDIKLGAGGVLEVPGESGGQVSTFECDSTTLNAKLERRYNSDRDVVIYGASVCSDGKITPEDFELSPSELPPTKD